jgi:hypothetical protein
MTQSSLALRSDGHLQTPFCLTMINLWFISRRGPVPPLSALLVVRLFRSLLAVLEYAPLGVSSFEVIGLTLDRTQFNTAHTALLTRRNAVRSASSVHLSRSAILRLYVMAAGWILPRGHCQLSICSQEGYLHSESKTAL